MDTFTQTQPQAQARIDHSVGALAALLLTVRTLPPKISAIIPSLFEKNWCRKFLITLSGLVFTLAHFTVAQQELSEDYRIDQLYAIPYVTSIVWAADGSMFFTEKMGKVHLVKPDGVMQEQPVVAADARALNEDGLQSIVLDPNFEENRFFYIYYTEADADPIDPQNPLRNVIVRYTEAEGKGINPVVLLEFLVDDTRQYMHNGGRLRFGPDGYLYVSVGDLNHYNVYARDVGRIEGKIHRFAIKEDRLEPAPGNPFPDSSTWAYGLRNVFSFTFDPFSGHMFATENGSSCDDEVNWIVPGGNYGWGVIELPNGAAYEGYCERPERHQGAVDPLVTYTPTIAPTGIMIYDGEAFPEWRGDLFFCAFKTFQMSRVELNDTRTAFASDVVPVSTGTQPGCAIEIAQGPDGLIYYSNTLGIYRLAPAR